MPHKILKLHWGHIEIVKKFQSAFTDLYFLTGNTQKYATEHKIAVVNKTLVSDIPKFQTFQ